MVRPEKAAVVAEVRERLEASTATVLTEFRGLDVDELAQLRRQLREQGAEYRVVKNTMTRRAAEKAGLPIPDELLTGPTALTLCDGDPVAAAKVLKKFADQHPALVIKGGVVEGQLLDADQTRRLAELESREDLLGRLAGLMQQVLAQPAQLAQAGLTQMARLLAAYQDQRDQAGDGDGAAATPAAPEPDSGASAAVASGETEPAETEPAEGAAAEAAAAEDDPTEAEPAEPTTES